MIGEGYAIVFKKFPNVPEAEEGQIPSQISREVNLVFNTMDGNILAPDETLKDLKIMPGLEQFELEQQQIFDDFFKSSRRSSQINLQQRECGQAEQRGAAGEEIAADESHVTTNVNAAGGTGAMQEAEATQTSGQKQSKYAEL